MKLKPSSQVTLMIVSIIAIILYCFVAIPQLRATDFDDAYMFLRYAKHWLAGNGFSWNIEDGPAYGATSTLHLFMVTAVRGLTTLPDPLVLTAISFTAGIASVIVLTAMGFVFFDHLKQNRLPLLVVPITVISPVFIYHSITGMETTEAIFFNSLLACAMLHLARQRTKTGFIVCLLTAYASYLTRPDAGIYCLLLPPLFLLADDRRQWKQGLCFAIAFIALICVDLAIMNSVFGSWLPLPFFVKSTVFQSGYIGAWKWNAAAETLLFFRIALPYILVIVLFASRNSLPKLTAIFLPVLLTFGYLSGTTQVMGFNARYYYPTLPFFILGAYITFNDHFQKLSSFPRPNGKIPLARGILALFITLVLLLPEAEEAVTNLWEKQVIGRVEPFSAKVQFTTPASDPLPRFDWWESIQAMDSLLQKMPPTIVIAASE